MDPVSLVKALIILVVYFVGGPALGFLLQGRDKARRFALGFMAWWLVRPPSDFTLTLYSIDRYRGHSKGFEFNFLEAIALGFSLAALLEKRKDFKWMPPALWIWLLWVGVGCLSVAGSINALYVFMPALKFLKMSMVFCGIFHAIHDERDVKAMMKGFAIALIVQLIVCLFFRYAMGAYRVIGWFEHQNPMAMWSYMVSLPLLGLALTRQTPPRDVLLYLGGFGSAGLVVLLTVSRAALAAFALGTMLIMIASFLQGITVKKVALAVFMMIGGAAAMAMAMDTFMARMEGAGDDKPENDLRWVLNKQSAAMLADHPLTGIGWNNFGLANSRPLGTKYSNIMEDWEANRGSAIYPENFRANPLTESLYWLFLAETGGLGFGLFILFIATTVWFGLRGSKRYWKTPLGLFLFGVTVALTVTYFHGRVERVLTQTKNLTTWVMFCGLLARVQYWRVHKIDPSR